MRDFDQAALAENRTTAFKPAILPSSILFSSAIVAFMPAAISRQIARPNPPPFDA